MSKIVKKLASVSYRTDDAGVTVAVYGGAIAPSELIALRDAVADNADKTLAFVVRMERACLMMGIDPLIPDAGTDYSALPGGCIVCRPDQMGVMRAYAKYMAERGVIRVVFLDSEIQQALNFSARHARYRK